MVTSTQTLTDLGLPSTEGAVGDTIRTAMPALSQPGSATVGRSHSVCAFARHGGLRAYGSGVEACIRVAAATGFEGVPTSGHIELGQRDRAGWSGTETGWKARFSRKDLVKPQVEASPVSGSNLLGSTRLGPSDLRKCGQRGFFYPNFLC